MAKINKNSKTPPAAVEHVLSQWGRNIRIARLRRKLRLQDLADHVGVSRYLMSDIEKGKPTAAIASYIGALWALGLMQDLDKVADPDKDIVGKTLQEARAPKTAAKRKEVLENDF
jgi:transcriptional regulator with XRE-family HTH domain